MRIILLAALLAVAISPANAIDDLSAGLGAIPWGTKIQDLPDMIPVGKNQNITYFANPLRQYTVLDTPLPQVIFGFHQNAFFAVYIPFDDVAFYARIQKAFSDKYGRPKMVFDKEGDPVAHQWNVADTKIKLKQDKKSKAYKLAFYYIPMARENYQSLQDSFPRKKGISILPIDRNKKPPALPLLTW